MTKRYRGAPHRRRGRSRVGWRPRPPAPRRRGRGGWRESVSLPHTSRPSQRPSQRSPAENNSQFTSIDRRYYIIIQRFFLPNLKRRIFYPKGKLILIILSFKLMYSRITPLIDNSIKKPHLHKCKVWGMLKVRSWPGRRRVWTRRVCSCPLRSQTSCHHWASPCSASSVCRLVWPHGHTSLDCTQPDTYHHYIIIISSSSSSSSLLTRPRFNWW